MYVSSIILLKSTVLILLHSGPSTPPAVAGDFDNTPTVTSVGNNTGLRGVEDDNWGSGRGAPPREPRIGANKMGDEEWKCPDHGPMCNPGVCMEYALQADRRWKTRQELQERYHSCRPSDHKSYPGASDEDATACASVEYDSCCCPDAHKLVDGSTSTNDDGSLNHLILRTFVLIPNLTTPSHAFTPTGRGVLQHTAAGIELYGSRMRPEGIRH